MMRFCEAQNEMSNTSANQFLNASHTVKMK